MTTQRRYPGTPPFQEQDAHIFFGREHDTKELLRLIRLKKLVVLYGKSGLGKTSLINAGIIPAFEQSNEVVAEEEEGTTYDTMKVRFFAWKDTDSQAPLETLRMETVGKVARHPLFEKAGLELDSLWASFKNHQLQSETPATYVLFFDQFEELFTYPEGQIKEFKQALAQLVQATIPSAYKQHLREQFKTNIFSKAEKARLLQAVSIKVVLGIRSDRLSLLDKMSDYLPNILVNLYELKALNSVQARAAIALPARQEGNFVTPQFQYQDTTIDTILNHLESGSGRIEPFQIQYICEHAEQVVKVSNKVILSPSDLGDLSQLFENYYHHKIAEIGNTAEEQKARSLLEDGLLFNGVRLSLLKEQITATEGFNIAPTLLKKLENVRLVRAEGRGEQTYYEITHDTLVEPISKSKELRLARERRRKLLIFGGLGLSAFLILLFGFLGVYDLYEKAQESEKKAIIKEQEAKDALQEVELKSEVIEQQKDSLATAFGALKQALLEADSAKVEALLQQNVAEQNVSKFKRSFSTYLMSEAKKEFEMDNPRLALRLTQEALKFYSENEDAKVMMDSIPLFLADAYLDYNLDSDGAYANIASSNFSKNGNFLVFFTNVIGYTGTLQILNLKTSQVKSFPNINVHQSNFNFSSDSKFLIFFSDIEGKKGVLQILNLETSIATPFSNSYIYDREYESYGYILSSNNKYLIFHTDLKNEKGVLQVLNLETLKTKSFFNVESQYMDEYNFSGKYLVFYTDVKDGKGTLQVLNLETLETRPFPNCNHLEHRYSPNSEYLLFYTNIEDEKGILQVLNFKTSKIKSFPNSSAFRYSFNKKYLVFYTNVEYDEGTLQILNLETLKTKSFPNSYFGRCSYMYSPDAKYLMFYTNIEDEKGILQVLNLETLKTKSFPNSYYDCRSNTYRNRYSNFYSSNSKYLVFYTNIENIKGTLQVLNLETLKTKSFTNSTISINSYRYSSDNKYLVFHTDFEPKKNKGTLQILNLETLKTKSFTNSNINSYRYSSDNKYLVFLTDVSVRDEKGVLQVLNLKTLQSKSFTNCNEDNFEFSSDDKYLIFFTSIGDKRYRRTLQVLNLETSKVKSFSNSFSGDYKLSLDGKYLVFYTKFEDEEEKLQVLNLKTSKVELFSNISHYDSGLAYSKDSKYLAFFSDVEELTDIEGYPLIEGANGTLQILDLEKLKVKLFPNCYLNRFNELESYSYSLDSRKLAVLINGEKGLVIIDLNTMQETRRILHQTEIAEFQFSKDNSYVLSSSRYPGSPDGVLKITDLEQKEDPIEYYDKHYAPLSSEEKAKYRLD